MDSTGGGSDFQKVTEANYNKLSTALTKVGYKDGISDGRDSVFQLGFDAGYTDGLKTAFEIAKWKTIRDVVRKEFKEINIPTNNAVLDAPEREHHQVLTNPTKSVDEISKLQSEYSERIAKSLNTDFQEIKQFLQ